MNGLVRRDWHHPTTETLMRTFLAPAIALCSALIAVPATAQTAWPSKPIRLIVSYSAGGAGDQLARMVGNELQKSLKQPVVVENKPGASGMLGASACKAAPGDGYNFCVFLMDVVTSNPVLFKNVAYQPEKDFVPVAYLAQVEAVVPTATKTGIRSMKELADAYRADPAKVNWGSWGVGSSAHLLLSAINSSLGTSVTHVPYQNTPALVQAVLTGEVTGTLAGYTLVRQHIERGELRPLAALGTKRLKQLPQVPTLQEQGIPFTAALWYGLFAPSSTPREVVVAMNAAVRDALALPASVQAFEAMGNLANPMSPDEFAAFVQREAVVWGDIARASKIVLD
jgi:tripartite-type tricarboxylate transporter receptor subunit TctC